MASVCTPRPRDAPSVRHRLIADAQGLRCTAPGATARYGASSRRKARSAGGSNAAGALDLGVGVGQRLVLGLLGQTLLQGHLVDVLSYLYRAAAGAPH